MDMKKPGKPGIFFENQRITSNLATCRECMCTLISGKIKYRIAWPGLLAEEKAQGFILPCVAVPESDLVIDVPRAKKIG